MSATVFNQEAELAILNIILNHPDSVYNLQSVKPFMFSSTPNILIFSTMLELASQNLTIEPNLLITNMESRNKLVEIGGKEYISYLNNLKYNINNLKEYERQLVANYKTKFLLSTSAEITKKLSNGDDVGLVINELRHKIDNLEITSGGEQVSDLMVAGQEMWEELKQRVEKPGIRGVTTGFSDINGLTGGYNAGDLWVVAGRPGMGKTADLCNTALSTAMAGTPVLIFSLEMRKAQLVERMVSIRSGVPLMDIRNGVVTKQDLEKISETLRELKTLPIYIDNNSATDATYYATTTRKYNALKDVRVTFFDYVQLATERGDNQTAAIGVFSRIAKLLANELGITTVLYSQLNRAVELREDKRPVLPDLRQSGNLEEDADMVMFLYRDEYYYKDKSKYKGIIEKIFAKHRNGPTGTIFGKFNETNLIISDGGDFYK